MPAEPHIAGDIDLYCFPALGTNNFHPEGLFHNPFHQSRHYRINIVQTLIKHLELFPHLLELMLIATAVGWNRYLPPDAYSWPEL